MTQELILVDTRVWRRIWVGIGASKGQNWNKNGIVVKRELSYRETYLYSNRKKNKTDKNSEYIAHPILEEYQMTSNQTFLQSDSMIHYNK